MHDHVESKTVTVVVKRGIPSITDIVDAAKTSRDGAVVLVYVSRKDAPPCMYDAANDEGIVLCKVPRETGWLKMLLQGRERPSRETAGSTGDATGRNVACTFVMKFPRDLKPAAFERAIVEDTLDVTYQVDCKEYKTRAVVCDVLQGHVIDEKVMAEFNEQMDWVDGQKSLVGGKNIAYARIDGAWVLLASGTHDAVLLAGLEKSLATVDLKGSSVYFA
jgi:hypothetical protein